MGKRQSTEREGLLISSGVGADDFEPYIEFEWSVPRGKMAPDEARMMGSMFLEAAIEAEKDSAICRGFLGAGQEPEQVAGFLVFMREARDAQGSPE